MNKFDLYLNMLNVHPHPYWNYIEDEHTVVVFLPEISDTREEYGHMCMCDGPCTFKSGYTIENSELGWLRVLEKLQKMFPDKIVQIRNITNE